MPSWQKWGLIGVSGGAIAVLAVALTRGPAGHPPASVAVQPTEKSPEWNTSAVSVARDTATVTYGLPSGYPADRPRFTGYVLEFAVQNDTSRDITIPADAVVMRRLYPGGALVDSSAFATLRAAVLVPAHQRAAIVVDVDWICRPVGGYTPVIQEADPAACYDNLWGGTDAWELFDSTNHLQVRLPKPPLTR